MYISQKNNKICTKILLNVVSHVQVIDLVNNYFWYRSHSFDVLYICFATMTFTIEDS